MPIYKFRRTEETTHAEILEIIQATPKPWLKGLAAFLYLYGCRVSEALNLTPNDVFIEGKYLIARIGVLKRRKKTNAPYADISHLIHVPLTAPFVKEYLLPYLASRGNQALLFNVSRQAVWESLKELNPNISPHIFRHDRLMKLALKGASESELKDFAGWTDTRPASNYIRSTGRLALNLANKIE